MRILNAVVVVCLGLGACAPEWGPRPAGVVACIETSECDEYDCAVWENHDPTCNYTPVCVDVNDDVGVCQCEASVCS